MTGRDKPTDSRLSALVARAAQARAAQQPQLAVEYLQQVLRVNPHQAHSLGELAALRLQQGQNLAARALAFAATRREPENPKWQETGCRTYLATAANAGQVRRYWQRLQDLQPNNVLAVMHLCDSYFVECNFAAALPYAERAATMQPDNFQTHLALAKCQLNLRQLDAAKASFERAITLNSEPAVVWEQAMFLLLNGNFKQGWAAYESRLRNYNAFSSGLKMFPFPSPQWQGEPLKDKTILVHGEQGLGDEIMFCAMIADLVQQGAKVILACSPSLTDLVQRSFATVTVIAHGRTAEAVADWQRGGAPAFLAQLGHVDYQCPLGSLAQHLRPDLASFEVHAEPYLKPDPQKVSAYRQKLGQQSCSDHKPIFIGLVWSGNRRTGTMGQFKSIDLTALEPLHAAAQAFAAQSGVPVYFVSLHNTEYGGDVAAVPDWQLLDFQTELTSFDETAALASACDWVISVDTSVCHLSAALGQETWVPLRFAADWRYVHGLDHCVWYRTMRLFRQQQDGDWLPVIEQLAAAVTNRLKATG